MEISSFTEKGIRGHERVLTNRPLLIIFGAGNKGRMLLRTLEKSGDNSGIHCFIDSDPAKRGNKIGNLPVLDPDYLTTLPPHSFRVLVAVGPGYAQVRERLIDYGLTELVDFEDVCVTPLPLADLDKDFQKVCDRIGGRTLFSSDRLQVLHQFAGAAACLPGDAAEVGVYRGGTAYLLASVCSARGKCLHLFDTFRGAPAVAERIDFHREGDFADTSLPEVKKFLDGFTEVLFHPGVFPESAGGDAASGSYCFVHVDADMYRSVHDSCAFFYPRLAHGATMLFDDYGFATCPGVRKAVDEFFADKRQKPIYLPTGQALVINLP
ncbi:MAG TPA: TylF/MycF/NovP-related O-methyltransferase [Geobacteraceae bacterium]|nr:TylF/MycF/NovP-related O-methyltransferase [Geobacteraceae bacterium]